MKFHFIEKIPDNFFQCSPKISGMTILAGFCSGEKPRAPFNPFEKVSINFDPH
ncbi:hypothetical protein [Marivirga lumbricoides]|uniref:hypothetical protein n=1 Tax=Marivirga lumbricoides TaxID=1046115 RepID=UPI00166853F0